MKSLLLLLLRVSTGAMLIIWGVVRATSPETGVSVANKYYGSAMNAEALQVAFGWAQMGLGVFVILGLFRLIVYPLQALVLLGGAAAIWKYLADPLGLYLLSAETRNILFFPSTTVAVAALILLVFKRDDSLSLDRLFK